MNDETSPEKPILPETNPQETPDAEPVESSMELAPGWWEVLLEEIGRLPEEEVGGSARLEPLMVDAEEPAFRVEDELGSFAFDEEHIPESLWDLAPDLRTIADREPRPELPPPAEEEEPVHLLPPAEDFRPVDLTPDEPRALPAEAQGSGDEDEGGEDIQSIWEVVPSWWQVYENDEVVEDDSPDRLIAEEPAQGDNEDWVTALKQSSDLPELEGADSIWDYAPDLREHLRPEDEELKALPGGEDGFVRWGLPDGEALAEAGLDLPSGPDLEGVTENERAAAEDVFFAEDEVVLQAEEPDQDQLPVASEVEFPIDDESPVDSVWEAVPSWWQVYAANLDEESAKEDEENRLSYFDYESLEDEEGPLAVPLDDEERMTLSDELVKYIEETQERIETEALLTDAQDIPQVEEPAGGSQPALLSDLEIPEELQDELEKEEGARPRYATLPFVLGSAAAIVVLVVLMWMGGGALLRAFTKTPSVSVIMGTSETIGTAFPDTMAEFVPGPYDANAKPVGLELKTGVVFSLQEGELKQGRWEPQSPEWLPGADLVKIVAIPWKDNYAALVEELEAGDTVRLAMSNWVVEEYTIKEVLQAPRTRTDFLSDRKLSMVVIFSRGDDAERWVVLLDRTR